MSRHLTNEQVASIVHENGWYEAIISTKAEYIKDDMLRSAFNRADSALADMQSILEPFAP